MDRSASQLFYCLCPRLFQFLDKTHPCLTCLYQRRCNEKSKINISAITKITDSINRKLIDTCNGIKVCFTWAKNHPVGARGSSQTLLVFSCSKKAAAGLTPAYTTDAPTLSSVQVVHVKMASNITEVRRVGGCLFPCRTVVLTKPYFHEHTHTHTD